MTAPIDTKTFDIKPQSNQREERREDPKPFKKMKRKKPLSSEVEEETLSALKTALKKQKTDSQVAVSQFEHRSLEKGTVEPSVAKIGKLEPSAQVTQLYSKLADRLIHMHKNGITSTTITLGDAFKSSIFRNAVLTVTEFSTAPKIFNIRFSAGPEAVAFFETHATDLTNALNNGKFKFSVYHVDTSIAAEKKKHLIEEVTEKKDEDA